MLRKYELLNVSRHATDLLRWFTDTTTSTLKEIGTDFKSVSDHEIVRAIFCFYCGCQKYKGRYPGRTQLVALLILILSHRRFDVVIVDEVDMLMLDEGVLFTYLSHNAAILRHIEPVTLRHDWTNAAGDKHRWPTTLCRECQALHTSHL